MNDLFPYNVLKPLYDVINDFFNLFFSYADDYFFFGIFPYIAIILAVFGFWHRFRSHEFSQTTLSSQFLNRSYSLPQALNFFHYGIGLVLLMHFLLVVLTLLIPNELNEFFLNNPDLVMGIEIFLWAVTFGVIIGITVFIIRRIMDSRARTVTTRGDWLLFLLLFLQVNLGFLVATGYYPGAQWYSSSLVPWFVSLATLSPDVTMWGSFAGDGIVKFHAVNGFVILAVLPYTRLVHLMSLPYGYLFRKYQIIVWYAKRKAY